MLYIYQRVLCVKFVMSTSYLSKWEEIVSYRIIMQKKSRKKCICLLFDMLSCVPAAITLRVCRVHIEEGLYDVRVGLEVNLRGLVG